MIIDHPHPAGVPEVAGDDCGDSGDCDGQGVFPYEDGRRETVVIVFPVTDID